MEVPEVQAAELRASIYVLQDPRTATIRYAGKTKRPVAERLRQHVRDAARGANTHCARWIRTLTEPPLVHVIASVSLELANYAERDLIALLRSEGHPLTNSTDGGDGGWGCVRSPETRAKMSAAQKGRKMSAEQRAKLSASMTGRKLSPEQCARMGAGRRGRKASPEHRAKISAALKGRRPSDACYAAGRAARIGAPLTEEWRRKISAAAAGRKPTPETLAKMSAAQKGHTVSAEQRAKISAAKIGRKFGPLAPETRAKISAAKTGKKRPPFSAEWSENLSASRRGEANNSAKLSETDVQEIRARFAAGETNGAALATEYGIRRCTAWSIIYRKTWKHLPEKAA